MSKDVFMRSMKMSDLSAIEVLERDCFDLPWSKHAFKSELKNKCAYYTIMERESSLIAYAGMWLIIDEAHITNVAVHPNERKNGYGQTIMLEMMRLALVSGMPTMTLEVRKSNIAAIRLYEKLGFSWSGVRKGYYSNNGEDAIIMWNRDIASTLDSFNNY